MFDFMLAGFGMAISIAVCAAIMTFAFAATEQLKRAMVGAIILSISVMMACGFGGAIWG
jgi:hypothetical protein